MSEYHLSARCLRCKSTAIEPVLSVYDGTQISRTTKTGIVWYTCRCDACGCVMKHRERPAPTKGPSA